jgi:putative FmdB family regulatory protein
MHQYEFRCKSCRHRFSLSVQSYAEYDALTPTCPNCGSVELSRLIGQVAVQRPNRDYTKLGVNEIVSVFDSGDSRQVGEMFQQFGDQSGGSMSPGDALPYHDAASQLLKGETMEKVERDLAASTTPKPPSVP